MLTLLANKPRLNPESLAPEAALLVPSHSSPLLTKSWPSSVQGALETPKRMNVSSAGVSEASQEEVMLRHEPQLIGRKNFRLVFVLQTSLPVSRFSPESRNSVISNCHLW